MKAHSDTHFENENMSFHILKIKAHFEKEPHFGNESSFWNPFWKYMYLLTHSKCNERTVKSVHSYKWSFKNLIKVWIFCKIIWTFLNVWQCRKLSASDIQTLYKSSQKLMYRGSLPYATFGSGILELAKIRISKNSQKIALMK